MTAVAEPAGAGPFADAGEVDTIILGAGAAGLAVGACLRRAGVPFLILERADRIGASWHRHYDRLHLHTDKARSALPFFPFPKDYPRYPSRLQVIRYLEAYAEQFRLAPRFGQEVVSVGCDGGTWEARTHEARYRSRRLVIATGYARVPYRPAWPGQSSFRGEVLHSSEYRNGAAYRDRQVLVVGFGNSGGEIALDLWEHGALPSMAVRSPVNVIPREILGIPVLALGTLSRRLPPHLADALNAPLLRFLYGDLERYGLRRQPYGPLEQVHREGRIPLIDIGTVDLIRRGAVRVYPGVERFDAEGVRFTDGQRRPFDAVVLATGYRPGVDALLLSPEAGREAVCEGVPVCSGKESPVPGLYFCGFFVSSHGMLREIAGEAQRIASDIAWRYAAR